jgi:ribose/xylose/arabinose/galactoside ABC-type transport system permease subunit
MRIKFGRELMLACSIIFLLFLLSVKTSFLFIRDVSGALKFNIEPIRSLFDTYAYTIIAAVGMTLVIIAGQIDLSVGSTLAVCSLVAGYAALVGMPIPLVALLAVFVGLVIGCVNGIIVAWGRIHSIIVTLGTLNLLRGLILLVTKQEWLYPPDSFKYLGRAAFLGFPLPVWMAVVIVLIAAFFVKNTRTGREIYAVGSNPNAAVISGINVPFIKFITLALNGLLIGIASLAHAPRFTAIQNNIGKGFELMVITCVVIGGTSIFGGSGSIWGSVVGVIFIGVVRTAMVFLRIPAIWEQAVYGAFLLIAVAIDAIRARRRVILGGI